MTIAARNAPDCWIDGVELTCALILNTALSLGLELGADLVQQLVQALVGCADGRHDTARRIAVIHDLSFFLGMVIGGGSRGARMRGSRYVVCVVCVCVVRRSRWAGSNQTAAAGARG
jgi:hypothetical protein